MREAAKALGINHHLFLIILLINKRILILKDTYLNNAVTKGGLKLHILNKIKDTSLTVRLPISNGTGEKNNTLVPRLAQVQSTSFFFAKHNQIYQT